MSAVAERITEPAPIAGPPPSPAGPVTPDTPVRMPPSYGLPATLQGMRFAMRPMGFNLGSMRRFGDVWQLRVPTERRGFIVTCHPGHVESLLKAKPADAPSLTGESPLRPIVGPSSVLTSVGEEHMRQRKLLLPQFHGEAVARYVEMISEVAEREIDSWPVGEPFALAPRMQAITLEVIMRGVFGVEGEPERGTPEFRMRDTIRRLLAASTHPLYRLIEMRNSGRAEARGVLAALLAIADRQMYAVIRERRADAASDGRGDVLSLLLRARDESGELLTDRELRDQLMSLLLAGHETTANQLAWAFERLLRTPAAYDRLREHVRGSDGGGDGSASYVEATVHEAMRVRPVIPMIVRLANLPWRLGEYVVPARSAVAVSIIALHHRADVYDQPLAFAPERFLDVKPGTYTWMPFGGGIRRCLGATLAMAEQRVVLQAMARRTDMVAPDPAPERGKLRNVTMIPRHGAMATIRHVYPG